MPISRDLRDYFSFVLGGILSGSDRLVNRKKIETKLSAKYQNQDSKYQAIPNKDPSALFF